MPGWLKSNLISPNGDPATFCLRREQQALTTWSGAGLCLASLKRKPNRCNQSLHCCIILFLHLCNLRRIVATASFWPSIKARLAWLTLLRCPSFNRPITQSAETTVELRNAGIVAELEGQAGENGVKEIAEGSFRNLQGRHLFGVNGPGKLYSHTSNWSFIQAL